MENEALSKLIPVSVLLFLGIIEALGGLYFNDKRSRNDFSIELLSLITLPTLIQPGIFLFVEIIELYNDAKLNQLIKNYFDELISLNPELDSLISDGIKLIKN